MTAFAPLSGRAGPLTPLQGAGSPADTSALACRWAIELSGSCEHRVLIIGGSEAERRLAGLGLGSGCTDRISAAAGRRTIAARAVRRYIAGAPEFDVVQPWDESLAGLADADRLRVAPVPTHEEITALVLAGDSILDDDPGTAARAAELRGCLGVYGRWPVVLLGADPPDCGDSATLFRILGLADKAGDRFAVILPGGVSGLLRSARVHRDARLSSPYLSSDLPAVAWVRATDVVIVPGGEGAGCGVIAALASRRSIPVVNAPACGVLSGSAAGRTSAARAMELATASGRLRRALVESRARPRERPPAVDAAGTVEGLVRRWTGRLAAV